MIVSDGDFQFLLQSAATLRGYITDCEGTRGNEKEYNRKAQSTDRMRLEPLKPLACLTIMKSASGGFKPYSAHHFP